MPDSFRIGEFHVEPSLHSVRGPAGTVRLEAKVMQVLVCLAEHGDQVVPKERLIRAVWPDTFVSDDVLTRAISELRRVFGDDVRDPRFIQTIPKSGYRLMAPVSFTGPEDRGAAAAQAGRTETLQSTDDGDVARAETDGAGVRPRASLRSWKRGLAMVAVVAAVLLAGVVAQRITTSPLPKSFARSGSPLPGRSPFHRSRRPSSRRSPPTAGGFTSRSTRSCSRSHSPQSEEERPSPSERRSSTRSS